MNKECPKCGNTEGNPFDYCGELREPDSDWHVDVKKSGRWFSLPDSRRGFHRHNCTAHCPIQDHFHFACSACKYKWRTRIWEGKSLIVSPR